VNQPTPEQIERLPKWAQAHIRELERDRRTADEALARYLDDQTPTQVWYEEMLTGLEVTKWPKRYINAHEVRFVNAGVALTVRIPYGGDNIELDWGPEEGHGLGDLCFIPTSYQQARISNMAYTPREYENLLQRKQRAEAKKSKETT